MPVVVIVLVGVVVVFLVPVVVVFLVPVVVIVLVGVVVVFLVPFITVTVAVGDAFNGPRRIRRLNDDSIRVFSQSRQRPLHPGFELQAIHHDQIGVFERSEVRSGRHESVVFKSGSDQNLYRDEVATDAFGEISERKNAGHHRQGFAWRCWYFGRSLFARSGLLWRERFAWHGRRIDRIRFAI